jgi:tetratricopeptide (TPR) repeat protein
MADPDPGVVAALGWALADRYARDGDEGDRDGSITWLRLLCDTLVPAESAPAENLRLASLLIERAEEHDDLADATAAIGYAERGLADSDGNCQAFARYLLGVGYLVRASIGSDAGDLPAAIGRLREAAALVHGDDPDRRDIDARLGTALAMWVITDQAEDRAGALDEAIRLLAGARQDMAPSDAFLTRVRYCLAAARATRFMSYAGSEADIRSALPEFEAILEQPGIDAGMGDLCHIFTAFLLLFRTAPESVRRGSGMDTVARLAELFARPQERPAPDDARSALDQLDRLSDSSRADPAYVRIEQWLRCCAELLLEGGDQADGGTARSADVLTEALRLTPEDDPAATELRGMLGLLSGLQGMREPDGPARSQSVDALVDAARQLGDEHPMLPVVQSALGGAFGSLGDRRPARAESTAAIDMLEAVLDEVPDDHPARAEVLIRLGALLIGRAFELDRSVPRLKKLRGRLDEAIGHSAAGQLNEAMNHCVLGMLEGIEGLLAPDPDLVMAAADRLARAADTAPPESRIRPYIQMGLISLLCQRHWQGGELQCLDAAMYHAREIVRAAEGGDVDDVPRLVAQYVLICVPAVRDTRRMDTGQLNEMIAQLEALYARMPAGHPFRSALAAELPALKVMRGGLAITGSDFAAAKRDRGSITEAADAAVAMARATPEDDPQYPMNLGFAGNARAMQGVLLRDRRITSEGIALVAEACARPMIIPEYRRRLLGMLAIALRMRYDLTRDRADLNSMISRLEEARRIADEDQGGSDTAGLLYLCALGYYERNDRNLQDRHRATALGLGALRERSTTVLLQSTTARAFDAALAAVGEAADVARWCLADGNVEAAVEALERGRGMVLHAATTEAGVPVVLREAGHDGLAAEWETALTAAEHNAPDPWESLAGIVASPRAPLGAGGEATPPPEVRLPNDLRYRVVKTLEGTGLERLLAPPPVTEIVDALRAAAARALVYLLPQDGTAAGLALIIDDEGEVREIRLPRLRVGPRGPAAEFAEAQRVLHDAPAAGDDPRSRWRLALEDLCGWAWTAAMEPVLDLLAPDPVRLVRLVLVPVGDLGLVPWHAACRAVAVGDLRYACQDAIISYAASARQFTEARRNGRRPWQSAPALVRVPGSGLFFASKEVQEIRLRHYAEGILLGGRDKPSPPATPGNVRGLLPRSGSGGVSLLHLGCHAEPAARPVDGRLVLEDGETLSMRDILQQARARPPGIPGCLVVLAACGSDLTAGHHDEALTLATSFLAAGAVGAVGTRWPVADLPTLALMTMFHHYLNSGYDAPATALRAAQGWMLNPGRSFSAGFHPKIAEMLSAIDLTKAEHWAAFTYQGQ